MNVFTQALSLEVMTEPRPPGVTPQGNSRWRERTKNRNLHSVKFPDDLEEDYQQWRKWHKKNDNEALKHLVRTHPDLKQKPEQ